MWFKTREKLYDDFIFCGNSQGVFLISYMYTKNTKARNKMQSSLKHRQKTGQIPHTVRTIHILPFSAHNKKSLSNALRNNIQSLQARVNKLIKDPSGANYKLYFADQEDRNKLTAFLERRTTPLRLVFHGEGFPPVIGLCSNSIYDLYAAPLAECLRDIIDKNNFENLTIDILCCLSAVPCNKKYIKCGVDIQFARDLSFCLTILGLGSINVIGYTGLVLEKNRSDGYSVVSGPERGADHASLENARIIFQHGQAVYSDNPHFKMVIKEASYRAESEYYYRKAYDFLEEFKERHQFSKELALAAAEEAKDSSTLEDEAVPESQMLASDSPADFICESRRDFDQEGGSQASVLFKAVKPDTPSGYSLK